MLRTKNDGGGELGNDDAAKVATPDFGEGSSSPFTTKGIFDSHLTRIILTLVLLGTLFALALNADFYTSTMVSPYLSLALFSAIIVLGIIRRSWLDLVWVIGGVVLLYVVDYRILGFKPMIMAGFSFIGFGAFAVLGVHTIWAKGEDRKLLLYGFVPATLFVGSEWIATTLLDITERLHPKTFDLFLYSFDSSLRVQISFLTGQLFWKFLWLRFACILFYIALPLPLALVYAAQLRHSKSKAIAVMIAFLVTGPLGVFFYNILPACGPVHVFGVAFPFQPLSTAAALRMSVVPILIKGARNAIPSLHMTWVLLIWWNSNGLSRWVRAVALTFVWATALATMGIGEHYFIDLVVAFPFSLLVQGLSSLSLPLHTGERRVAILFGTFSMLTWLALLSFETKLFWISPLIPWAMIAATIASSMVLWHRLLHATTPKESVQAVELRTHPLARARGAAG